MAKKLEMLPKLARQYYVAIRSESPRGFVLVSTGFLEQQLKQLLMSAMAESDSTEALFSGGTAALGSFSARVTCAHALALITDDELHNLTLIRKIRNDFAHRLDTTFETDSVKNRCAELRVESYSNQPITPYVRFQHTVWKLTLELVQRHRHVTRPTPREWPTFEAVPLPDGEE